MGRIWSRGGRAGAALVSCLSGVTLTACAGAGGSAGGSVSAGSCIGGTASAYLARARVAFIGTALPGPTIDAGSAGAVLASPARFRVVRYLKGSGPGVVTVATALSGRGDAVTANEDGIEPRAGQRWKIYTTSLRMPYVTSICGGSCVMGGLGDDVNMPCAQLEGRS